MLLSNMACRGSRLDRVAPDLDRARVAGDGLVFAAPFALARQLRSAKGAFNVPVGELRVRGCERGAKRSRGVVEAAGAGAGTSGRPSPCEGKRRMDARPRHQR